MTQRLTFVAAAGRNKHGQQLGKYTCTCGREKIARVDSVRSGNTRSCGKCTPRKRRGAKSEPTAPPKEAATLQQAPAATNPHPRGTAEWFRAEITHKDATALTLEAQARELEEDMKVNGIQPAAYGIDASHKQWQRCTTTAHKLRIQIARFQADLDKREAGLTKKKVLTTADRVAMLKGNA